MPITFINNNNQGGFSLVNNTGGGQLQFSIANQNAIVTDNLLLYLDASNASSYPGSGNIWYDLQPPANNLTLYNNPVFTSAAPSYFTFNGTNQYGGGSGNVVPSTAYTKCVWFYLNATADNNLVSSDTGGHFMYFAGTSTLYCGHANWSNYAAFPSSTSFSNGQWYFVVLTFNTTDGMKLYVNGTLNNTYTANKTAHGGNGSTNIACFGLGGNLLKGRIAQVMTYGKALTNQEVLQNYNSQKSRFGL